MKAIIINNDIFCSFPVLNSMNIVSPKKYFLRFILKYKEYEITFLQISLFEKCHVRFFEDLETSKSICL